MIKIKKVPMAPKGPELSQLVQGYWRLAQWDMSASQRLTFMKQHIEMGITTVDHADIYGGYQCETLFGQALKLEPSLRQQIEIISKCDIHLAGSFAPNRKINHYDTSDSHIISSVNNSLSRLGVDYLDVLLIHRPDFLMDADQIAATFEKLSTAGKVKHFGVSNFTPSQFSLLQSRLNKPLITNQVEINPIHFQVIDDGTLDQMQQNHIRPMAWSCLAGGDIFTQQTEQAVRLRATLSDIAQEMNVTMEQVVYAFITKLPSKPIPIIGSGNIERVRLAAQAMDLTLTREQWYQIWVASKGHGVP